MRGCLSGVGIRVDPRTDVRPFFHLPFLRPHVSTPVAGISGVEENHRLSAPECAVENLPLHKTTPYSDLGAPSPIVLSWLWWPFTHEPFPNPRVNHCPLRPP